MNRSTTTHRGVRLAGLVTLIAGIVMVLAGATTWATITSQLSDQQITVAEDSSFLPGDEVNGPFSAFAEAQIINEHALAATEGKTYAQLDQDDPVRDTAMNASFLRASLFTSVVAYGVSALVMGLGVLFGISGWALRRLAVRPSTVKAGARTVPELAKAA